MKVLNEFKISFPSRSVNEGLSRIAVSAFAAQLDPPVDELSDVKTAVSEAVTNCIVHAYKNTVGTIEISMRILDQNRLYIKIKDKGCGIEDIEKAMEPLFTTAPEEERAGLGFAVMESFMDKLSVRSKVSKGTTIIMYKKFSSR
ncbi:MAG TPA: anti-sigma F factor [Oscillospiraceae bacterium]|nr:anti-sigma F factor [Oscillospiraceae bacterium]